MKYNNFEQYEEPSRSAREIITAWIYDAMQSFIDAVIKEMTLTGYGIDSDFMGDAGCDHLTHMKHNITAMGESTVACVVLLSCGCISWSHLVDFVKTCHKHSEDGEDDMRHSRFSRKHERKLLELFPEHYSIGSNAHHLMVEKIDEETKLEELLKDVSLD